MSSYFYQLYIDDIMALTRSMVIKSVAAAESINSTLISLGHSVSLETPETWKYYLNISGEFHSVDVPMVIKSMDTLEEIEFTKENLSIHRATAKNYSFGSRYLNDLIKRFPDQELLIKGIVSPVDLSEAIAATDGTILGYLDTLVEGNESNLITSVQSWIDGFYVRWNNGAYAAIDELYVASFLSVLYVNIPQVIINTRLENCHTPYAHSFHIREYLASNGKLDAYVNLLTKKQALWLYRNIRYVNKNAGKKSTFNLLVDKIMTERRLPLVGYDIRHNLEGLTETLAPATELMPQYLNFKDNQIEADPVRVQTILDKEILLTEGNLEERDLAVRYIPETFKHSMSDQLPTKVLESLVVDVSGSTIYSLESMLINQWVYLAAVGRYEAVVSVTNPVSGQEIIIPPGDAFFVYFYAYNKARGLTFEKVPALTPVGVKRSVFPTFAELRASADPTYVTDEDIHGIMDDHPEEGSYKSRDAFYEHVEALYALHEKHRVIYGIKEHFQARGQLESLTDKYWTKVELDLYPDTYFDDWFDDRGYDFAELSPLEADILANELLNAATGLTDNETKSVKEIQQAMLSIMEQLTSYTVQYLNSVSVDRFIKAEWGAVRNGDVDVRGFAKPVFYIEPIEINEVSAKGEVDLGYDTVNLPTLNDVIHGHFDTIQLKSTVDPVLEERYYRTANWHLGGSYVNDVAFTVQPPSEEHVTATYAPSAGVLDITFNPNP